MSSTDRKREGVDITGPFQKKHKLDLNAFLDQLLKLNRTNEQLVQEINVLRESEEDWREMDFKSFAEYCNTQLLGLVSEILNKRIFEEQRKAFEEQCEARGFSNIVIQELWNMFGSVRSNLFERMSSFDFDTYPHMTAETKVECKVRFGERYNSIVAQPGVHHSKKTLKEKDFCDPKTVPFPKVSENDPKFVSQENWLEDILDGIQMRLKQADSSRERVPPMALVRCSRGGKTRALYEIAQGLKGRFKGDICVIYVSFNDFSSIDSWEQNNPLQALCLRIGYVATNPRTMNPESFDAFRKANTVSDESIIEWLAAYDGPCVLLIDELNLLDVLKSTDDESGNVFARFLKTQFLAKENRYFVFTSHWAYLIPKLSMYMESVSNRGVILKQLPVVTNLKQAQENLKYDSLTATKVCFYGSIPAIILQSVLGTANFKLEAVLDQCREKEGFAPEKFVVDLLKSFVSGSPTLVPQSLLQFMDTYDAKGRESIRWIPANMVVILSFCRDILGQNSVLYSSIKELIRLFHAMEETNETSGDGWEVLFRIAILIRCLAGDFCAPVLPLDELSYTVSYCQLNIKMKTPQTFISFIKEKKTEKQRFPHIAIYEPQHRFFEVYDLFLAVFKDKESGPNLFGYQLKQGAGDSTAVALEGITSFLIRGKANEKEIKGKNWYYPSNGDIEKFFGESARYWTPKVWKALHSKDVTVQCEKVLIELMLGMICSKCTLYSVYKN